MTVAEPTGRPARRPIRIAGASGSASDRRHAIQLLASRCADDPVDVIMGDWMSEYNMVTRGFMKSQDAGPAYEETFLEALVPALPDIARHGIKVVVNAGASDTARLAAAVEEAAASSSSAAGGLRVAWVSGDEATDAVAGMRRAGSSAFRNTHTGQALADWPFAPIYAQAYLGGMGVAAALAAGADVVVCGRVADASPVIGAAAWWHGWTRECGDDDDCLAAALVAGHLIECSTYVTGGNFSGFKDLESESGLGWRDLGFPIAEIAGDGGVVITKQKDTGGVVTTHTCTAQLLYEIQGPVYLNSDVAAVLNDVSLEQVGADRVALRGVRSAPPPPTTKVGITARGGYQAELHWSLVGLDAAAKARMIEEQIRALLPEPGRLSRLEFTLHGTAAPDADVQAAATVDLRVVAQAREAAALAPDRFVRPCLDVIMQAAPGATPHMDLRQALPREVFEYFVTTIPQARLLHLVHLPGGGARTLEIPPPERTATAWPAAWATLRDGTDEPVGLEEFGSTVRGPLGWVVHARSGDKGSDSNVGFWVRHRDEWDWLRSLLSVDVMKSLLGKEYKGDRVDRFELPNLRAVHFLLHNHLDRGAAINTSYDILGKNVAEFLRARYVDIPVRFLERGKL